MIQLYKGKAKNILVLAGVVLVAFVCMRFSANAFYTPNFHSYLTNDTIPKKIISPKKKIMGDSTIVKSAILANTNDTQKILLNTKKIDTSIVIKVDSVTVKTSKDSLDAPVTYHADDSMVLDVPNKKMFLYGKENSVKYIDNELIAPHIEFDQQTNLVSAYLTKDSLGNVIMYPTFMQADFKTVSDSIQFDMKSGKGLTKSTYTQQGEMFIHGDKIKKVNANIFYALNGRFTTCNYDTPHFAFVSKKIKFINKKMAFTGPVHPEIEGIPLPIYLPFGIYPLSQGRHSGVIAPTFTANAQLGLALEGLGYYKILSKNWDVVTRGTIYSYGGWVANVSPRYFKRYHYQGSFSVDYNRIKDIDGVGDKAFNIRWSHSSDSKARPGVSFSANVNAGSSKFNQSIPNSPQRNFQNNLNSSIVYSKIWKDKPFSLTLSANHNQNTTTKQINLNLPDIGFNVNTLYPFRKKEVVGTLKWYENIGVALNSNVKSLTYFYDTASNIGKQLIDKLQWGASHNIPITLSLPEVGHLQFSPSISYQERWYQQQFIRSWNGATKKVDTTINKGFYSARDMQFGMGVSTRIFGMFTFKNKTGIQAIRHEIRPTISANYKPDFNKQFYYRTQIDSFKRVADFSVYDGSIFGGFSQGKFGGLSFGIDNNIQMKVKSKKDTSEAGIKKISLIDGFSINSSYNFLDDSFKLKPFNISARTNLFDQVSITAGGTIVPYATDKYGEFIDKLVWNQKRLSLGTLTNANIALQTQFKGGDKKEKITNNNTQQGLQNGTNPVSGLPLDDYQKEAAYISNNPAEFANFNIPWSVSLSYGLNYSRIRKADYSGYSADFTQNVTFNGTLNLTPKWQIGLNGYYNITTKDLGALSMYITREMHCWQMAINLTPIGRYRSFNITISPKSGILRDLKINRSRYFYDL
jgi:LPS-assembly protein